MYLFINHKWSVYSTVSCPVNHPKIKYPWYALVFHNYETSFLHRLSNSLSHSTSICLGYLTQVDMHFINPSGVIQ